MPSGGGLILQVLWWVVGELVGSLLGGLTCQMGGWENIQLVWWIG